MQLRTSLPLLHDFKIKSISYTRPPSRPRRASGALGALQGREGNAPGPRHPSPIGLGSREPWVLLARDMGALAALWGREGKGPEPPGNWGPSGGPQGAPGPFPSRPRLGASGSPRSSWGPAALGALRGRRGPEGPRDPGRGTLGRGLGPRGREDPDSGGPKERRAPCALGGTAAEAGGPRPGGPWGSAALVTLRERRGPWGPPTPGPP